MTSQHLELPIAGMSCASCANRVERSLNDVDGVVATVNYATERATVDYDPATVTPAQLVSAVEKVGYSAAAPETDSTASLRRRLVASAALSRAGAAAVDGAAAPVRRLGVGRVRARHPGRSLGRLAVPRRRLGEREEPGGDHGHARIRRRARRVDLVRLRALRGHRHLLRDRLRHHDLHPRRPLVRGPRQAAGRRRHPVAARARREGGGRARPGRHRASRAGRPARAR